MDFLEKMTGTAYGGPVMHTAFHHSLIGRSAAGSRSGPIQSREIVALVARQLDAHCAFVFAHRASTCVRLFNIQRIRLCRVQQRRNDWLTGTNTARYTNSRASECTGVMCPDLVSPVIGSCAAVAVDFAARRPFAGASSALATGCTYAAYPSPM